MTITFRCQGCHKDVSAPDAAAGKRGKCPYCGDSTYIPVPVAEDELLDLAPIDDAEEQKLARQRAELLRAQRELLAESGPSDDSPLEHRESVTAEDLHHFVVNYCIDMANGELERAETYIPKIRKFNYTGVTAVEDFLTGRAIEPALDFIPRAVLKGLLTQLAEQVRPS